MNTFAWTTVLCAAAVVVSAQQPRDPGGVRVTGTARISGQVVTDETTPRGIGRAIVTLGGDALGGRSAITDDDGRFAFANLPPGRFTVAAEKPAYLPAAYGARRPGRPGTAIVIDEGAHQQVTLRMARGAVLTGTIRDADGQPVAGADVTAVDVRSTAPQRASPFAADNQATTDDRGIYRIYGLLPGEYHVVAALSSYRIGGQGSVGARSTADMDALLASLARRASGESATLTTSAPPAPLPPAPAVGFLPTYFPGTPVAADAERIPLAAGEERISVDFILRPALAGTIAGTVDGVTDPGLVELSIYQVGATFRGSVAGTNPILIERPAAHNGAFRYTNVTPGTYRVVARLDRNRTAPLTPMGSGTGSATSDYVYALAEVEMSGGEAASISLSLQPGGTVSGRVLFDATAAPPPADLSSVRVELRTPDGTFLSQSAGTIVGNAFQAGAYAVTRADGTFTIRNVAPGSYRLLVSPPASLSSTWTVRSATGGGGSEWLDGLVDIAPGAGERTLQIVATDRRSEIAGTLQAASGVPAPEYFVVVFPADKALWAAARRVKSTRPDNDGRFAVGDLPAGQYLLAALTDVEPADLSDARFLERIAPAAIRLTLADGEQKVQDVTLAAGSR